MTSAASFIDQINAAYREVIKAESGALPHAIRCGEFLTLAKENLKAERGGKWSEWLETNCHDIAQETASLYKRLAEHKAKVGKAKSINAARKLLPKGQPRGAAPPTSAQAGGVDRPSAVGPNLEDEIEVRAADELFAVLTERWEDEELEKLVKLITDHLQKKKSAASKISNTVTNSPPDLSIPDALRRKISEVRP